jgi:outer membrane protein assembly factor BamB
MHLNLLARSVLCGLLALVFAPAAFSADNKPDKQDKKDLEAEIASRAVPMPRQMDLDIDWYSPHIDAEKSGKIVRGWVINDLVLLETDKHVLVAVRKDDGYEKWRCELTQDIRYQPSVSNNNVLVNVNNFLIAIEKNVGDVRWRLLPSFVMSCAPIIVDPPSYPKEYNRTWQNMESIYVGSWDGRLHALTVRGREGYFVQRPVKSENFSAPEFTLYYSWHKSHNTVKSSISNPLVLKEGVIYYTCDDKGIYSCTRDGVEKDPYFMQDVPTTGTTVSVASSGAVSAGSIFVGSGNGYVYALDRLTLRKKWEFAAGYPATGTIAADEPRTPYVYVPTNDGVLHALEVKAGVASAGKPEIPETFSEAWTLTADGTITMGPEVAYLGVKRQSYPGFLGVVAVEKSSGKVLWKVEPAEGSFFTGFLEFHNNWSKSGGDARIFAMTRDNRIVCLKEKERDTRLKVFTPPKADAPVPTRIVGKAAKEKEAAEAPKDAAPADAPKEEKK